MSYTDCPGCLRLETLVLTLERRVRALSLRLEELSLCLEGRDERSSRAVCRDRHGPVITVTHLRDSDGDDGAPRPGARDGA